MYPVIILAGGLATRLRPLTETIPKALIKVANKPFICHQLDYLKKQGITQVVLCVGYLGEMIESIVGNGSAWNIKVSYSFDGPILLGTGGAIKQALQYVSNDFFVLYGDSYLPINYQAVETAFIKSQKPALMTVLKNANRWDKSNVIYENGVLIEYNKDERKSSMKYIDYGLGILNRSVFEGFASNQTFDLAKVYNDLSSKDRLAGFEVFQRFYEIGSLIGIEETQNFLLKNIEQGKS